MTNLSTLRNALLAFDYNHMTPYAVGFDRTFDRLFDYVTHQLRINGYPPLQYRKTGAEHFTIEMLIAGFGKKDIEVEFAEGLLTVKSLKKKKAGNPLQGYLTGETSLGKFTLADDIIVKGAKLDNGMLTIDLERIVPEWNRPQLITVK